MLSVLFLGANAQAADGLLPELQPGLLVQTTATLFDQDNKGVADPGGYGDPEDDVGFKLRRLRLGFVGENDRVKYGVQVGMSTPFDAVKEAQGATADLEVVDAYGGYSPTESLWVIGGLQKVPVSREKLMAGSQLALNERSIGAEWLAPGRDLGLVLDSHWKNLRFRVGVFNGSGDLRGDDNSGKLVAGRIEAKTGKASAYRTYGVVDALMISGAVDAWMNDQTAVKSSGAGVDFLLRFKGIALLTEARVAEAKPKDDLVDVPGVFSETKRQGMMVQIGYTVSSFEPVARFSTFDDDKSVEDVGDVMEAMAGMTWHSEADQVRAGLGYVARLERGPSKVENDSVRVWFQLKI